MHIYNIDVKVGESLIGTSHQLTLLKTIENYLSDDCMTIDEIKKAIAKKLGYSTEEKLYMSFRLIKFPEIIGHCEMLDAKEDKSLENISSNVTRIRTHGAYVYSEKALKNYLTKEHFESLEKFMKGQTVVPLEGDDIGLYTYDVHNWIDSLGEN